MEAWWLGGSEAYGQPRKAKGKPDETMAKSWRNHSKKHGKNHGKIMAKSCRTITRNMAAEP